MARRFELIVFDWDGTLLDSAPAIVASIKAACVDLGIAPPSDDRARYVIGLGLRDAMEHALPELDPADYPRLAERYRHHYLSRDERLTLFEGAESLLLNLRDSGYRLGVATGKTRVGLDRALRFSGLQGFFHSTRCADECPPKPHPAMLLDLLGEFDVEPMRALMVGDTTHDMRMAREAGVPRLAVTFGAHSREALISEDPLACVGSIAELAKWMADNG